MSESAIRNLCKRVTRAFAIPGTLWLSAYQRKARRGASKKAVRGIMREEKLPKCRPPRFLSGRDHTGSRQPRGPQLHRRDDEREMAYRYTEIKVGDGGAHLSSTVDCYDGKVTLPTWPGPVLMPGSRQHTGEGHGPASGWRVSYCAFRQGTPLPVARMVGTDGTIQSGWVDGREGLFSRQCRHERSLWTYEARGRLSTNDGNNKRARRCRDSSTNTYTGKIRPFAVWCGWVCQVVTVLRSSLPQVR